MRILLLSAYDAASHRRWRDGLVQAFPEQQWTVLSLPARYFSWRLRGNSLSWAFAERETLTRGYDLLISTSMCDLSALRGFVPELGRLPTIVYFHENQFAYPNSAAQRSSIEPQVLNLYTALAADKVLFNSHYNRQTFIDGAAALLAKMPDHVPAGLVDAIEAGSDVLPVPLEQRCFQQRSLAAHEQAKQRPLSLLWNHRWEYDKGPERLFAALFKALEAGVELCLRVVGEQFRSCPAVFAEARERLLRDYPGTLEQWGFIEDLQSYHELLLSSDVVLSTALHDFQGLAVLEAAAAGCIPLVPDRLCYPQWFEKYYRYASYVDDADCESGELARCLGDLARGKVAAKIPAVIDLKALGWPQLKSRYGELISQFGRGDCGSESVS